MSAESWVQCKLGVHARDITASQSVRRSASEQWRVFKVQVGEAWNSGGAEVPAIGCAVSKAGKVSCTLTSNSRYVTVSSSVGRALDG
jgi:hypothetical protein